MAVEVVEFNIPFTVGPGEDMKVDNGNVAIKFGSHGVDEPIEKAENKVSEPNLPKDVVDEWPEPQQIHSFYFVRYRPFEDQNVMAKLDMAVKELQKKNQARQQLVDKLKEKKNDRSQLITQLRSLIDENKQFGAIMDEKRKEMEPLQQALGMLRGASGDRERGSAICTSEQELNNLIKSYQYRIQHESIPLSEEKQILREIKQLEGTREKVIAYAAERAKIEGSMGEKEAIQGQVKLIGVDLDGVRKGKQVVSAQIKELDEEQAAVEKVIDALKEELTAVTQKRDQIYENMQNLWKLMLIWNSPFYQNRTLLNIAKTLAANKDLDAVKELADTEAEKFMSQWNSNKIFRNEYEKRILQSLDTRQLSKDGRVRNPGEKPLVQLEKPIQSHPEPVKTSYKQTPKEDLISSPQVEQKVEKPKSAKNTKDANKKPEIALEKIDPVEKDEVFSTDNLQKGSQPERVEVDEAKLKEMKREEEIAKCKQAEERKKMAEKAAAKAAIKAQKDAEKKLKEREKKARKKSGAVVAAEDCDEQSETVAEVAEEEGKVEEKIETLLRQRNKDRKENTTRHRVRPRGSNALPKAVLKRKKATNYWIWAGLVALVMLVILVVGYYYLM